MNMNNIYYFGVYKPYDIFEYPENYIDNYEFLLKLKKISDNLFEIIDVLHNNTTFESTNADMFTLNFATYGFCKNMIIELDINNMICNISYLDKYPYDAKLHYSHKNSKYIFLESLDNIKENIIKNNKILSESNTNI